MTPDQETMLAEANERLLDAICAACGDYSDRLRAEGKTLEEINTSVRRYMLEDLEPWRVRSYRKIRRYIQAFRPAPTLSLQ